MSVECPEIPDLRGRSEAEANEVLSDFQDQLTDFLNETIEAAFRAKLPPHLRLDRDKDDNEVFFTDENQSLKTIISIMPTVMVGDKILFDDFNTSKRVLQTVEENEAATDAYLSEE